MRRLGEILRQEPPSAGGSGPVTAGSLPAPPFGDDDVDPEAAAELLATLNQLFQARRPPPPDQEMEGKE